MSVMIMEIATAKSIVSSLPKRYPIPKIKIVKIMIKKIDLRLLEEIS
jgi:hypothetical protein